MSSSTDQLAAVGDKDTLDTRRIDHLVDGFDISRLELTVVGVGSGERRPCSS
jgi:hypothetical protein